MFNKFFFFFFGNRAVYENVGKYYRTGQAMCDSMPLALSILDT